MHFSSAQITIIFLLAPFLLWGQKDTLLSSEPIENEELIENFIENANEDIEFDFNTTFENLQTFVKNPINLNAATREDLEELLFLTDIQIQSFLDYREKLGILISIYELQSIPSFDLKTINNILPFVTVKKNVDDLHIGFKKLLFKGNNEIYIRWSRLLEQPNGFSKLRDHWVKQQYKEKRWEKDPKRRHNCSWHPLNEVAYKG